MTEKEEIGRPRVLGIDPGTRRTGLAISDPLGFTAQGLKTFYSGKGQKLIDYIHDLINEYGVETVVIGMPLSMSGKEIEGSQRSRRLKKDIEERAGVEVLLVDERMTSLESERVIREAGGIKDKGDIDRLSAVLILQSYLDGAGSI